MTIEKNEKNYSAVDDELSKASLPATGTHVSIKWRAVLVGLFWLLSLGFVSITIFISSLGLLLFAAAAILHELCLKKYRIPVLPRTFTAWIHRTLLYDVFVRRVHGKRNLRACRSLGGWFLIFGLIMLALALTNPVLDLEDMVVERGSYSHFDKLARKHPCGNFLLTFHREDGTPFQFWSVDFDLLKRLQQSRGEIFTLWGYPNTYDYIPECRQHPSLEQMKGIDYQSLYDKTGAAKTNRFLYKSTIFFMACSGLCLLRIVVVAIKKSDQLNN